MRRDFAAVGLVMVAVARPVELRAQRCAVVEVEVPSMHIQIGRREQIVVIFRDRTGIPCEVDPPFTATSSNPNVARVEGSGYVVGVWPGTAVITVRTGTGATARTGVASIIVASEGAPVPPPAPDPRPLNVPPVAAPGSATLRYQPPGSAQAAGIVVTPGRLEMLPGEQRYLIYRTVDVTGAVAEPLPLAFSVEPSKALSFLTVDSIGVVTATEPGQATIRITAVGRPRVRPALVPVSVRPDSVLFSVRAVVMAPGMTDTVRLFVPAQDRQVALGQLYMFASSDTTVARVHLFQPVIEARSPGVAIITAHNPRLPPVQLRVTVRAQ